MAASMQGASRRLPALGGLAALIVAVLVTMAAATPSPVQAATWQTELSGSGHHGRTHGPATLSDGRSTRLAFWTARVWDADEDGGEWEYDWVKFRLIRTDTGKTVRTFGPYHHPTGRQDWSTVSVTLPVDGPYRLRAVCDDARWGFKLQQKY
jgi:hypothetical protein